MTFTGFRVALVVGFLSLGTLAAAQPASPTPSVPRVVRIDGAFAPADGLPPAAVEVVTLALYASETGGTPIWEETQDVRVDGQGRYAVFVGATSADGLPVSLLAAGEPRWLGIRFARPGESEQARVLLTSVPYALRASDADTLGGLPPSAFLLSDPAAREAGGGDANTSPTRADPGPLANAGTTNFIGKFTNSVDLGDSVLFENAGRIGLGTTTPLDQLHTRFTNTTGTLTGIAVQNLGGTAASYSGMLFYDQNGALGQFQGFNNGSHEYRINNIAGGGSINFMLGGSSKFLIGSNGDITIPSGSKIRDESNLVTFHTPPVFHTAVGLKALESWAGPGNGQGNTAVGFQALRSAVPSVSGAGPSYNVAVGSDTLVAMVAGFNNVAVGGRTLLNMNGGAGNIALGYTAGYGQTTGSHNMYLGRDAGGGPVAGESNTIRIGDQIWYERTFIGGIRDRMTGVANAVPVMIDSAGQLGTFNSSRRYKDDIQDMGEASSGLMKLRPVTYRFKEPYADGSRPIDYGLIAEEVEEIYPDLVVHSATGEVQTVQYHKVNAMLLNEVQKQHRQIGGQQADIDELKARVAAIERLLSSDRK